MSGTVHFEQAGPHICVLTIDNPPMNPLGEAMRAQLIAALDQAEAGTDIRAVVLTGKGKAFCSGADIKDGSMTAGGPHSFARMLERVRAFRGPVIGAINGWCIGGGFELALCCDIRLAAHEASFVCAGVNMGLMASAWRLPRLIGESRAKAMLLTGSPVDAATAEHYGLVTGLFDAGELHAQALALAQRIASRAPLSVEATKQVAGQASDLSLEDANRVQGEIIARLRESDDHKEAVAAFREKRDPVFHRR